MLNTMKILKKILNLTLVIALEYGEPIVGSFYEKEVDLSNYATKSDLNNVTHVDTSSFVL